VTGVFLRFSCSCSCSCSNFARWLRFRSSGFPARALSFCVWGAGSLSHAKPRRAVGGAFFLLYSCSISARTARVCGRGRGVRGQRVGGWRVAPWGAPGWAGFEFPTNFPRILPPLGRSPGPRTGFCLIFTNLPVSMNSFGFFRKEDCHRLRKLCRKHRILPKNGSGCVVVFGRL
jgi:hypothetical protein